MAHSIATSSLRIALQTLRANPLRTVLSTLGVVMGVASLVAVLAIGDGVEEFARSQLQRTTDLQTVTVAPITYDLIDHVRVPRSGYPTFTLRDSDSLATALSDAATVSVVASGNGLVSRTTASKPRAASITATVPAAAERLRLGFVAGRLMNDAELRSNAHVIVLSHGLAAALANTDSTSAASPAALLGQTVQLQSQPYRVIGVLAAEKGMEERLAAIVPFTVARDATMPSGDVEHPMLLVRAARVEGVDSVRTRTERWLSARYGAWQGKVRVRTEAASRLKQASQGIMIFKLAMGSFAAISLIVGGIGIMNVLLASVLERTREIGVRKAIGARQRDILLQFLAESVAISGVGSVVGVLAGLVGAFGVTAVMRAKTEAVVFAAFTWPTLLLATAIAIAIGLAFGTYPALRAARLSPIDAIRHE
ncbi:MAG TPA: ABC transporter permease [Gemmatimonadaceae bacterium]|nr:ABC transporter permease [Gemmatimonadaceae bacterium]